MLICNVALYKSKEGVLSQLFQAVSLEADIVVVVHVIYSDDLVLRMGLAIFLHKIGTYESSGSRN